jgi:hypothetical protein
MVEKTAYYLAETFSFGTGKWVMCRCFRTLRGRNTWLRRMSGRAVCRANLTK